jgi:hypothetical protein
VGVALGGGGGVTAAPRHKILENLFYTAINSSAGV